MPMFLNNLRSFREEDLEDVVIDLDGDKAPDLGEIEDNVLTSHDEEVEDAVEGLPGDPIEESYNLIAESEYNWNQIMETIGLHELSEMSKGRDIIYEAVDIKGFFDKAKAFFKKILTKVANIVKRYISNAGSFLSTDKHLLSKYGSKIDAGYKVYDDKFRGYKFTNMDGLTFTKMDTPLDAETLSKDFLTKYDASDEGEVMQGEVAKFRAELCHTTGSVSASDYQQELFKCFRDGKSDPVDIGKPAASEVKKVLGENELVKKAKKAYKDYEKGINDILKNLHRLESTVKSNFKDDDQLKNRGLNQVSAAIGMAKSNAGIAHTALTAYLSAVRKRHSQYRHIANTYVRAANKEKYPVKESGSFFDSLNLI